MATPHLIPRDSDTIGFCAALFTRMVFSALVDADYLDTEAYYAGLDGKQMPRGQHPGLRDLSGRLSAHLGTLAGRAGDVNRLRQEVLIHAREKAAEPPGLFTLTVPRAAARR